MNFDDVRAFVSVARRGSFSDAATDLGIAQSAISKRVQRLEQRMGTTLLERHARGVLLTPSGASFLTPAETLVKDAEDLERNLSAYSETPSGLVRIALPQRTSGLVAPAVIERAAVELPLVRLEVLEGTPINVHQWLIEGQADIGLTYNAELGSGFTVSPFVTEPLFLFIAPGRADDYFAGGRPHNCSIDSLKEIPLILPRKPHPLRLLVERTAFGHGFKPNIIHEIDGPTTTRGVVARGVGGTIFNLSGAWQEDARTGALLTIPFSSPTISWTLHIACSDKVTQLSAPRGVLEIVEDVLERLLAEGSAWPHGRRR